MPGAAWSGPGGRGRGDDDPVGFGALRPARVGAPVGRQSRPLVAPATVRKVVIAADRGPAGEEAAARLRRRLRSQGVEVCLRLPPHPFGDWNDAGAAPRKGGEEGRGGAPVRRG
uniref:toprim domain-containing protein n=1 Tax=Brevundimonas diminuta TaxID=293 RepID=UPI002852D35A|nr:toprim domain-containing protein [Brevundimonas diminuta]